MPKVVNPPEIISQRRAFVKPRENDAKIASLIKSNPKIPYKALVIKARILGISDFEVSNFLRARRLERTQRSQEQIKSRQSDLKDLELEIFKIFQSIPLNNDLNKLRKIIRSRLKLIISNRAVSALLNHYSQLQKEHCFDPLLIADLPSALEFMVTQFKSYENNDIIKIRQKIFLIFLSMLNGTQKRTKFSSKIRVVRAQDFINNLQEQLGFNRNHIKILIQDFVDAKIFRYTNFGKYIMVPTVEQMV